MRRRILERRVFCIECRQEYKRRSYTELCKTAGYTRFVSTAIYKNIADREEIHRFTHKREGKRLVDV